MWPIVWDWLNFAIRWAHVITGIAWIGSSFYFIALDLSLKKHKDLPDGVGGDTWAGAWGRVLPHAEIYGGPGVDAGGTDVV